MSDSPDGGLPNWTPEFLDQLAEHSSSHSNEFIRTQAQKGYEACMGILVSERDRRVRSGMWNDAWNAFWLTAAVVALPLCGLLILKGHALGGAVLGIGGGSFIVSRLGTVADEFIKRFRKPR